MESIKYLKNKIKRKNKLEKSELNQLKKSFSLFQDNITSIKKSIKQNKEAIESLDFSHEHKDFKTLTNTLKVLDEYIKNLEQSIKQKQKKDTKEIEKSISKLIENYPKDYTREIEKLKQNFDKIEKFNEAIKIKLNKQINRKELKAEILEEVKRLMSSIQPTIIGGGPSDFYKLNDTPDKYESNKIFKSTNKSIDYAENVRVESSNVKLGDITSGNYTEIESDGTLEFNGNATVWEDLNFDVDRSGGPAASQPDYVLINNVVYREFTQSNNQFTGAAEELPHKYKLGEKLYPHFHLFLKAGESAGTTGVTFTIYWELKQSTGTTSGNVPLTATSAELTANGTNNLTLYDNTGFAGAEELGAQLSITISRTGGDAGDVIVTTYGVHYLIDTAGSRLITTK